MFTLASLAALYYSQNKYNKAEKYCSKILNPNDTSLQLTPVKLMDRKSVDNLFTFLSIYKYVVHEKIGRRKSQPTSHMSEVIFEMSLYKDLLSQSSSMHACEEVERTRHVVR